MNKAKHIIKQKGITEGQLIDAGFSPPTVEKIMKGNNWPDPKTWTSTVQTVANLLGVSVDDLLSDNDKNH